MNTTDFTNILLEIRDNFKEAKCSFQQCEGTCSACNEQAIAKAIDKYMEDIQIGCDIPYQDENGVWGC